MNKDFELKKVVHELQISVYKRYCEYILVINNYVFNFLMVLLLFYILVLHKGRC